jgi:PAS domain-containing protein
LGDYSLSYHFKIKQVSFGEDIRDGKHFFTGIVRDVTNRKRSEEALRASEQRSAFDGG